MLAQRLEKTMDITSAGEKRRDERGDGGSGEFEPDLIVLDIMMPEIDGSDVAGAVFRRRRSLARTPIVFMTRWWSATNLRWGSGGRVSAPEEYADRQAD